MDGWMDGFICPVWTIFQVFQRSNSASLVAFNATMSASALVRESKFCPAVVFTVVRHFSIASRVYWNNYMESWIGAREDLINAVIPSLKYSYCFSSSLVSTLRENSLLVSEAAAAILANLLLIEIFFGSCLVFRFRVRHIAAIMCVWPVIDANDNYWYLSLSCREAHTHAFANYIALTGSPPLLFLRIKMKNNIYLHA